MRARGVGVVGKDHVRPDKDVLTENDVFEEAAGVNARTAADAIARFEGCVGACRR